MSFYSDTENTIPVNQISYLITQQLPSFMTEEGEDFAEFLKKYYEWMESHELLLENAVQNEFKLQLVFHSFHSYFILLFCGQYS